MRATEVTFNKVDNSYHPHIHALLCVESSYFKDTKNYITQKQWTSFWKRAMKLDYDPIVDVRSVKSKNKDKIDPKDVTPAVLETAKYPVKDSDYLTDNEEQNIQVVADLEEGLNRKRLISYGGLLKEVHKELNLDDVEDGDFIKFMEGIEELPSGIEKQGAEKVANWLTKKTGVEVIAEGENLLVPSLSELDVEIPEQAFNSDLITTFGVTDCIIAVGLMIGTVGFPLSKITKLKKAIDFLGGVNKTVNRIYKSYKKYKSWNYRTKDAWKAAVNESAKGLPQDTLNAFLDFFNISNVVNNCT